MTKCEACGREFYGPTNNKGFVNTCSDCAWELDKDMSERQRVRDAAPALLQFVHTTVDLMTEYGDCCAMGRGIDLRAWGRELIAQAEGRAEAIECSHG